MDSKTINEVQIRLYDLKARATRVDYKCQIPRFPTFKKEKPEVHESQMIGFNKRLCNWERVLLQFENPGGMPRPEQGPSIKISEGVNLITNNDIMS